MLDFVELPEEIEYSSGDGSDRRPTRTNCVRDMQSLSRAEELCGLSLSVIDVANSRYVSGLASVLEPMAAKITLEALQRSSSVVIVDRHPELSFYGLRIPGTDLSAGGILLKADPPPDTLRERILATGQSVSHWESWCYQHSGIRPAFARKLLAATYLCMSMELMQEDLLENNSSLVGQLSSSYETMTLMAEIPRLYPFGTSLDVLANAIILRVQQVCETDWAAYCVHELSTTSWRLYGEWGIGGEELERFLQELHQGLPPQIVVRNQSTCPLLRKKYPQLRSFVAVPIIIETEKPNWLILANPLTRPELGSEEAHLLKSVGHLLASHALQREQMECLSI